MGLILAVCILGMALVMLNERLGKKNEATANFPIAESGYSQDAGAITEKIDLPQTGYFSSDRGEENARAIEQNQAREALRPPVAEQQIPVPKLNAETEKEALKLAAEVQLSSEAVQKPIPLPMPKLDNQDINSTANNTAEPISQQPESKKIQSPKYESGRKHQPSGGEPSKPKEEQQVAVKQSVSAPQPKKGAVSKNMEVKKFVIFARENGATVRITGNGPMAWRSMVLDNPPRVVLDLDGEWSFPAHPGVPKNDMVNTVRVGKPAGNKTRVVIDLKNKPKSSRVIAAKDGDGFDVRVDK